MAHNHQDGGHQHGIDATRESGRRKLTAVLVLTTTFTVAEVVGAILTGSLALLADAGHMLSDDLSLGLALFAAWIASRPATSQRTFGYQRAEILAALFNGVTLVAISIWIFIEAGRRLADPPEVEGELLLVVALLGLAVNVAGFLILSRGEKNLNVSAAARHVLADLLGSVGVITSAVLILLTGWLYIDPLISVMIGLLVLGSSWSVLRDSTRILLEATPAGIDAGEVGRKMATVDGVREVHDLHIWTITSGFPALAAHVLVGPDDDCHGLRRELEQLLLEQFDIDHTTLQVDHQDHSELLQIDPSARQR